MSIHAEGNSLNSLCEFIITPHNNICNEFNNNCILIENIIYYNGINKNMEVAMEDIKIYAFSDEASEKIDEQIQALKDNNLNGMEIRGVDGTNIADISLNKAKEVKKKLDDNGLSVWSIGSPIGKIDIDDQFEPHLDKFKKVLEISDILGAKNIRLFSFFMPDNTDVKIYKNKVLERLNSFCEVNKGTNITLCHENEKGIYGDDIEKCLEIFSALPEIKAVFDPANFVQCQINPISAWESIKEYVHYVHIKDALYDGNVVPAGKGDGCIEYIAKDYINRGGKHFTMEPHLMEFAGLAALEKDGKTSEIGQKYTFSNNREAFDFACKEFNSILKGF